MALLKADIDQLNKLSGVLDDVGSQIDGVQVLAAVEDIKAALPGCRIPDVCAKAGDSTEYAWLRIADRFRTVSHKVKQAARDLDATDESFREDLESLAFVDKDS